MAARLLLLGAFLVVLEATSADVGLIKADVRVEKSAADERQDVFCLAYNTLFHPLPSTYSGQPSSAVANFSLYDGCSDIYTNDIAGKVVAITRGNCTFTEKAVFIQRHGGIAALIVDYANESSVTPPGGNSTDYNTINITVAIILHHDFTALLDLAANVKVWLYAPNPPSFDPNVIVMFSLATLCAVTGAYLSATAHHHKKKRLRGSREGKEEEEEEKKEEEESVSLGMGIAMSIGLVIFFCVSLSLLYFFYDYLVYVIIAIFCVAGVNGLFHAALPLWRRAFPCESRLPVSRVPCMSAPPRIVSLGLFVLCVGFVATWVVFRHATFSWVLQDIIGFCFCLYVMRALMMPSLKACTVLLGLLFCYDIFFVFITPLFTKNGESVMIKVATGGDSKSGEQMPTVFRIPYFLPWEMSQCLTDKYSLLGYGDVIVPGLLLTFNCAFDLKTSRYERGQCRFLYFTASAVAYLVGLLLTGVALYLMKSGQPALLYLVPCTVLTTVIMAAWTGELGAMWRGHECPKKDDNIGAGRATTAGRTPRCNRLDGNGKEEEEEEEEEEEDRMRESQSLIQ